MPLACLVIQPSHLASPSLSPSKLLHGCRHSLSRVPPCADHAVMLTLLCPPPVSPTLLPPSPPLSWKYLFPLPFSATFLFFLTQPSLLVRAGLYFASFISLVSLDEHIFSLRRSSTFTNIVGPSPSKLSTTLAFGSRGWWLEDITSMRNGGRHGSSR